MKISFQKFQGTGNDFILIDNRDHKFPADDTALITRMCDRKFGIGADGLILIEHEDTLDFKMIFFNPDGSKSLCGNGSRCAVAFAHQLNLADDKTKFITTDGPHDAHFDEEGIIHFSLHDVSEVKEHGEDLFIDTGSPHYIRFVKDLNDLDVIQEGRSIRYDKRFAPGGTNVNFVELKADGIAVRTYERGVEDETLSCGTGVTACALAATTKGYTSPVNISTSGGNLQVSFEQTSPHEFRNIYLAGPVKKVFEGVYETVD
ncbi:MAG: diaminopimelate epimerase [Cyclobacteriaceae bacterium]